MKQKLYCPRCRIDRFFTYNLCIDVPYQVYKDMVEVISFCNECMHCIIEQFSKEKYIKMIEKEKERRKILNDFRNRKLKVQKNIWNLWGLLP